MKQVDILMQVKDLSVSFSRWGQSITALDRIHLSIGLGEWVVCVGPNGSGKSTLLKSICGQAIPTSGIVQIGGKTVSSFSSQQLANKVFYVHQDPLLGTAPLLTVFENLMVADHQGSIDREPKRALMQKYTELLTPLGLQSRLKQPAQTLSGGERQLLALLIARLRPGNLVLLDEPLSSLDPAKSAICLREIEDLHTAGKTVLFVTHNMDYAATVGTRTIVLQKGRLIYDKAGKERSIVEISKFWYTAAN